MEGLNLGDLEFELDESALFDGQTGEAQTKVTPPAGTPPAELNKPEDVIIPKPGEEKNNTDGDDVAKLDKDGNPIVAGQESVATQGKDNDDQVQAGKTADGKEGSDSSSPKLNETEQLYSKLAAEFKAKGVLPELDITKIKSLEDLNSAIQNRVDNSLSARQKAIEDAQKVGAEVPEVASKLNVIEKLKGVTPEFLQDEKNLEFRRTAIIQDGMSKGFTAERSKVMAQRSIDAGTDVEDAKDAVDSLIKGEETSLQSIIDSAKQKEQKTLA